MEKYIDLEKIAAEYDPNKTSPAEQRLADVVVAAIRELAPNAVEQSGKKDHEYGVYTQEELETPLTFEAKADDTKIYFLAYNAEQARTIEVSTDDGKTWTEFTSEIFDDDDDHDTPIAILNIGEKVLVRGDNPNGMGMGNDDYCPAGAFYISGQAYVYGNIMSLLSKEDFASMKEVPEYAFTSLFQDYGNYIWGNGESLFSHPSKKLLLPATTLAKYCYAMMFNDCKSLTTAPELPATSLAERCYAAMFSGCYNLTTAPKLPATTLVYACYNQMFFSCRSLTTAPELPATTLANNCYDNMFFECFSLTTAPKLPATTLAKNCYQSMFQYCTSLITAPELPATILAESCYQYMFKNCTSLTTAPELPATTLVEHCYEEMFSDCPRLSFVKCAFTTTPGDSYTSGWLSNVFPVGVILKKGSWTSGIPNGWTARRY